MKRIMLTIAAAVIVASAGMAQDEKNDGKRPERKFDKTEMVKKRTEETAKKYNLNEAQTKQLLELNTKYADKMGPRHRGGHHGRPGMRPQKDGDQPQARPERPAVDGKREEMRKQRRADMEAYAAELQKILTPDQYKAYKEDIEKRGPRGQRPQKQEKK